jgi:hypothetical protein
MSSENEAFAEDVRACTEDMSELLRQLNQRYEALVIVGALAEHIGSALRILIQREVIDADAAQRVVSRVECTAYPRRD